MSKAPLHRERKVKRLGLRVWGAVFSIPTVLVRVVARCLYWNHAPKTREQRQKLLISVSRIEGHEEALLLHARPFVGASQYRSWSHFVGIYRQKLTRSLNNWLLNDPTKGLEWALLSASGSGFWVLCLGWRFWCLVFGRECWGFGIYGLGLSVQRLVLSVWCSVFSVKCGVFDVKCLGCSIECLGLRGDRPSSFDATATAEVNTYPQPLTLNTTHQH